MQVSPKKKMIVSGVSGNVARITLADVEAMRQGATDEELCDLFRSSGDALALIVPRTEEAYQGACRRIGAQPCHPSLAAYPCPRG